MYCQRDLSLLVLTRIICLRWLVVWFNHLKIILLLLFFLFYPLFLRSRLLGAPILRQEGKGLSCISWRGKYCIELKYTTQNMALWLMHYFELKAFEIQQMQKETFPGLSLYLIKRRDFWEMKTATNCLSWGNFMAKLVLTWTCKSNTCLSLDSLTYLCYHGSPLSEA